MFVYFKNKYMSSKIRLVDILYDLNGSLRRTILLLWPKRNFLKTKSCYLENSMFLKTTGDGEYARHAILNYFIISACIFVHDKHTASI